MEKIIYILLSIAFCWGAIFISVTLTSIRYNGRKAENNKQSTVSSQQQVDSKI